jgi:hypothetical protein
VPAGVLGEAKNTGEVDIYNRRPVFFRVIGGRGAADDASVVDEDIDTAEVLHGFFYETSANSGIAYIAGESDAVHSDFCDQLLGSFGCVNGAVDGDAGASFGQRDGNACAEAARRTGDERCFAFQTEFFENQGTLSFPVGADGSRRCF